MNERVFIFLSNVPTYKKEKLLKNLEHKFDYLSESKRSVSNCLITVFDYKDYYYRHNIYKKLKSNGIYIFLSNKKELSSFNPFYEHFKSEGIYKLDYSQTKKDKFVSSLLTFLKFAKKIGY